MIRKTTPFLMLTLLLVAMLSACVPGAADAVNTAGAAAATAAASAGKAASSAASKAGTVASGAAATASKVACEGLKGFNKGLAQVGSLSPDTAVADVVAFKRKVDPFVNPMRVLAVTMGMDPVTQFILAYDAFGLLLNTLPADANLGAASNALTASMAVLQGATVQAKAALQCDS